MAYYTCHPMVAQKLIEREVCHFKNLIETHKEQNVVIFPAGDFAQKFYHRLTEDYGIDADFFIDNNPALLNGSCCGKPVLLKPWETDPYFVRKYFVLVATGEPYLKQIYKQLDEANVPHIHSDAYEATPLWERAKDIVRLLDDDYSRAAYLGLMWYWLTQDTSLIQTSGNQYFDVEPFNYTVCSDNIVDLGAYVGDTTEEYVRKILFNKIYVFEPSVKNRTALEVRVKRLKSEWLKNDDDIVIIPAGVGASTAIVRFKNFEGPYSYKQSDSGEEEVQLYALDEFFKGKDLPTLIKSDIEGAEQDMLYGAAEIIKNHKPKLAISIYHRLDDFVKIPEIIKQLNAAYNFAVRTHSDTNRETVLYCW